MRNFLNILASGARSFSFAPTMQMPKFDDDDEPLPFSSARTPAEIMRAAWEDVGARMWEAVREVEKEYGEQFTK
jgi:hypothetical protein